MAQLTENSIAALAVGQKVNEANLAKCTHKTGGRADYVAYSCDYLYKRELIELFGVTPKLKESWERRGVEFDIYFHITDGIIDSCRISKTSETTLSARGCADWLVPSQQELRIARRIIQFVTAI